MQLEKGRQAGRGKVRGREEEGSYLARMMWQVCTRGGGNIQMCSTERDGKGVQKSM